jgi:plasmid stability protein
MKNITVKVDDETYRKARILAAERETSVSALVREFLSEMTSGPTEEEREETRRAAFQKLWDLADARDKDKPGRAGPFNREEIYEERLR